MVGYQVILDAGMSGMKVDFPDANCWSVQDGFLVIGDGTTNTIGKFEGERHGTFNWSRVCGVVDMDDQ